MTKGALGKVYEGGEIIVRQGEKGDCMYVIQEGQVEVVQVKGDDIVRLAALDQGDFFGEMAIFEQETRSATVRALGEVRLLTVDRKTFLRRIQEDPSLAFRVVQTMSGRINQLNQELVSLKGQA
jgi:CRP/FNR family cyclic AMP-dependent transcriptional regulator